MSTGGSLLAENENVWPDSGRGAERGPVDLCVQTLLEDLRVLPGDLRSLKTITWFELT